MPEDEEFDEVDIIDERHMEPFGDISDDANYFSALRDRLPDGLESVEPTELWVENWRPEAARCHHNVDFWVGHIPGYESVRGWLVSDQGSGIYWIAAHSVVSDPEGKLLDITPPIPDPARHGMRFLRHLGTEEEFFSLLPRNNSRGLW